MRHKLPVDGKRRLDLPTQGASPHRYMEFGHVRHHDSLEKPIYVSLTDSFIPRNCCKSLRSCTLPNLHPLRLLYIGAYHLLCHLGKIVPWRPPEGFTCFAGVTK